jgi:hypothetical protein
MTNASQNARELPVYQCHKKVGALKIAKVHIDEDGQGVALVFKDARFAVRALTASQLKHKPTPEAGMYFVQYDGGYFSFSPAKEFEDGYTLVEPNALELVTKDELLELAEWERKFADAKKKASFAESEVKFRRLKLAEKVLGIKSEDDLKALSPEQVEKKLAKRLEAGEWRPTQNAPEFSFVKTNQGRYPSWSQLFIEEMGETAAARIRTETPLSYSYSVDVAVPA